MALAAHASEPNAQAITFEFALQLTAACSSAAVPTAAGAADSLTFYLSDLSQAEPYLNLHMHSVQRAPPSQSFFFLQGSFPQKNNALI